MNRRIFVKLFALGISAIIAPSILFGCKGTVDTQRLAALANVIGQSVANLAALLGQVALAKTLTDTTALLVVAIQKWQQGDTTDNIIQLIGDLELLIAQIPAAAQYVPLIDLALGTIQAILALLPKAANAVAARAVGVRQVKLKHVPINAMDYTTQWNALVPASLPHAHI